MNLVFALLALSKGKARMAIFGVLVPFVALVGAIRLARPGSAWAKRFYRRRPRARAKIHLRAYHHDRRWSGPSRRLSGPDRRQTGPEPVAPAADGAR